MKEEVKRLQPTDDTLRELYLKSGNQCAFPGCHNIMMNEDGNFIGQVCHIEAAMPGGERFNVNQTNEERRAYNNLMIMCYEHHIITDNVQKYTVAVLKEMKKNHEAKFTNIIQKISDSIKDYTNQEKVFTPQNIQGITEFFNWGNEEEEVSGNIEWINNFAEKLKKLPRETRNLFNIILERSKESHRGVFVDFETPVSEIMKACDIGYDVIKDNMDILEKYKLCIFDTDFDGTNIFSIDDSKFDGLLKYLKVYCQAKGIKLFDIIVNLRFDFLD